MACSFTIGGDKFSTFLYVVMVAIRRFSLAPYKTGKKLTGKEIDSMTDDEFSAEMHELADSVEEDTLVSV